MAFSSQRELGHLLRMFEFRTVCLLFGPGSRASLGCHGSLNWEIAGGLGRGPERSEQQELRIEAQGLPRIFGACAVVKLIIEMSVEKGLKELGQVM